MTTGYRFWPTVKGLALVVVYAVLHVRHALRCLAIRAGLHGAVERWARWRIRRIEKKPFSSLLKERLGLYFETMARVYEHRGRPEVARFITDYHAAHPYFARFHPETVYLKAYPRVLRAGDPATAEHYAASARRLAAGDPSREEHVELMLDGSD